MFVSSALFSLSSVKAFLAFVFWTIVSLISSLLFVTSFLRTVFFELI